MIKQYFFFWCILLLAACKKDDPIQLNTYEAYYPTQTNSYNIYNVDSIVYDLLLEDTTVYRFQIKEEIAEPFIDNQGDTALKINRYKRQDSTFQWSLSDVWSLKKTNQNIQKVEENIRLIKLALPVSLPKIWNANALNNLESESYSYSWIHKPYSTYDSTVWVQHKSLLTAVSEEDSYEVYALNVGMVEKKVIQTTKKIVNGQIADPAVLGGFELHMIRQSE